MQVNPKLGSAILLQNKKKNSGKHHKAFHLPVVWYNPNIFWQASSVKNELGKLSNFKLICIKIYRIERLKWSPHRNFYI